MEPKTKRKPRKNPLQEIADMEQEVVSLRKRADELEAEARQKLIALTCGTMAKNHGAFDSKAFAAVFHAKEDAEDEPETDDAEGGK